MPEEDIKGQMRSRKAADAELKKADAKPGNGRAKSEGGRCEAEKGRCKNGKRQIQSRKTAGAGAGIKIVQLRNVKRKFKTVSEWKRPEENFSCALCR